MLPTVLAAAVVLFDLGVLQLRDDLRWARDVPAELLLQLLAVSATAIMQPLDLLKMRRWWDLFMGDYRFTTDFITDRGKLIRLPTRWQLLNLIGIRFQSFPTGSDVVQGVCAFKTAWECLGESLTGYDN